MAAIFWTTLWGPVGLFLATPLTVCLVVIGRYVPQLEFLGVLLGSDPVLAPEERLYQRLLAGNLEEAVEMAEDYVDEHSSREFYDNVAIPALRLAENDRQRSTTDTNYRRLVADTAICVVREVEDHIREKATSGDEAATDDDRAPSAREERPSSVLCLAGRTELDRAAAEMMAQVLEERGIGARVLPPIAVSQGALGQLDLQGVDVVCLSYLHPQPQVYARYICRRLRRRAPHMKLVVCCWNLAPGTGQTEDLKRQMAADAVFASLEACVDQVDAWVSRPTIAQRDAPGPSRHRAGAACGAARPWSGFRERAVSSTRCPGESRRRFDAPIALVSFVDEVHRPAARGSGPAPGDSRPPSRLLMRNPLDAHVIAANEVLVSEDVTEDPRFADDPLVLEKGIRFYAGAPLRTSSGLVIGALCIIDTRPRKFPEPDCRRLQEMADELMSQIERRASEDTGKPQRSPTGREIAI